MSRIGNKVIVIPEGVKVAIENNLINVTGPKGQLSFAFDPKLTVALAEDKLTVARPDDENQTKMIHGTTRALLSNMVVGVSGGFSKKLELVGVGYKASLKEGKLDLAVGFSHPVLLEIPKGLAVAIGQTSSKNPELTVSGIDKQAVGQFAAEIRAILPPEPYKGKGIKYAGEKIRMKIGKKAGKGKK
jgi:large subunit ribosomal protein L6